MGSSGIVNQNELMSKEQENEVLMPNKSIHYHLGRIFEYVLIHITEFHNHGSPKYVCDVVTYHSDSERYEIHM